LQGRGAGGGGAVGAGVRGKNFLQGVFGKSDYAFLHVSMKLVLSKSDSIQYAVFTSKNRKSAYK
jgi:hypothetical protein